MSVADQSAADQTDSSLALGARLAASAYAAIETVHLAVYFLAETKAAYLDLGLRPGMDSYFPSRAAPMGAVPPEVVVATLYIFTPAWVASAVPAAWEVASPEKIVAARARGVDAGLRRVLGSLADAPELDEAADLASRACTALAAPGHPLYAGNARLPEPTQPHLRLWHAATLLREHRGDGHIAALVVAGLDPVEAMALYAGVGGPREFLQTMRGWTPEQWSAGEQRLRDRGLLEPDGTATEAGQALRQQVERHTDEAAGAPWLTIGAAGTARLGSLLEPVVTLLRAADAPAGPTNRVIRPRTAGYGADAQAAGEPG
ncbi:MAG: hypothetical protein NVSMB13_07880 [Mycobacteriales bacterium]